MFRDQSMHINEKLPNVHGNVLFLRVEQWRIQDFPLGGGGANLRCVHSSVKTYAKTKEMDPVGGGGGGRRRRPPWIRQC